jgi:AbrB family transcriptional regulator (stage V sporulation protein T)
MHSSAVESLAAIRIQYRNIRKDSVTMKATGIVRRIDDLGRVVIPKEIRRTMRIREGDPLEIYTDREGEVIFKKYSPIGELASFAGQYAETLHKTCGLAVAICDRDSVIACAGISKREYHEKSLSEAVEHMMEKRTFYANNGDTEPRNIIRDGGAHTVSCAMPIISEGDVVGCVVSAKPLEGDGTDRLAFDIEAKLIQTAAGFLGRQLET